jgi:hypothetical protein
MNRFRWRFGRQGGGYSVLTLFSSKRLRLDVHLIRMRQGDAVPWHIDPAPEGFKHFRFNFILRRPKLGGWFEARGPTDALLVRTSRAMLFRADTLEHRVTAIERGSRLVLSVGWLETA